MHICLLPESFLFPASLSFPPMDVGTNEHLTLSGQLSMIFCGARRLADAFMLASPEQSSLFSSVFLPLLLSSLSLPFLADG